MRTVRQWNVHEISVEASAGYPDPFGTAPVATFSGPAGSSPVRVPGFWDGGNLWRIRFAPPMTGRWQWRTENPSNPRDRGLHGRHGEVECLPAEEGDELGRHGFLRVSATGRTLEHADGTPFFWLGDTIWRMNYAGLAEVEAYARVRRAQGFNVACYYPAEPIPNPDLLRAAGYRPTEPLPGVDYLAPRAYQARVDPIVRILNESGLVVYLQGLWATELEEWGLARCEVYWRYLVARYAAYNLVWSLSGEWDGSPNNIHSERAEPLRALGRLVAALDPYSHLITVHPREGTSCGATFHGDDWLGLVVQQSRAPADETVYQLPYRDYRRRPAKPNLDMEHIYEGEERGEPALVRWAAYASVLQGGLVGHTYGAAGVWDWNTRYRSPCSPLSRLELLGAGQMRHFAALFRSLPGWPLLEPHPDWAIGSTTSGELNEKGPFCAAREGQLYVVYLPAGGRPVTLTHLGGQSYRVRWYSPRSGAWSLVDSALPPVEEWTAPAAPDGGDWVLVLDRETAA